MGDSSNTASKKTVMIQVFLRIIACVSTLAASAIMRFNVQRSDFGAYSLEATYESSPAFEYFVIGNGIAAVYLLITIPLVCKLANGVLLGVFDVVIMAQTVGATSAHIAISWVGKFGNTKTGWGKVCQYYEQFCDKTVVAIGLAGVGMVAFLFVCILNAINKNK